jgi:Ca2+/H+ antiporter, TMEM165/GDT1 family
MSPGNLRFAMKLRYVERTHPSALCRRMGDERLTTMSWTIAGPAILASFLASLVEAVEAFTIVLAVASVRGWRPALAGAAAGLILLVLLVSVFGEAIVGASLHWLQLAIGILLLAFGLRWLRKAILRAAGIIALHDETRIFANQVGLLRAQEALPAQRFDWLAGLAAGKAVVVEGLEIVFIVLAVGAGRGLILPASLGALAACAIVALAGAALRKPLARVPENALKFCVGIMLSAFGLFWTGEGLGVVWPGGDLAIAGFAALLLAAALILVRIVRSRAAAAAG